MDEKFLLWFDETKSDDQAAVIRQAAARYFEKHGQSPNVCLIHQGRVNGLQEIDGIKVIGQPNVLKYDYLLGVQS
jgi:hypothetical protein